MELNGCLIIKLNTCIFSDFNMQNTQNCILYIAMIGHQTAKDNDKKVYSGL
jgi:hypothetical protein